MWNILVNGSLWMARMEGRLSQSASNSPAPSRRQPEDNRLPASNSPAPSWRHTDDNKLPNSNRPAPTRRQTEDNRLPASNSPAPSRRQTEDNRLLEDRRLMESGPGDDSARYAPIKETVLQDFRLLVFILHFKKLKSSFYLPAFKISRSCRTVSRKNEKLLSFLIRTK
jgi:hypothetical protein